VHRRKAATVCAACFRKQRLQSIYGWSSRRGKGLVVDPINGCPCAITDNVAAAVPGENEDEPCWPRIDQSVTRESRRPERMPRFNAQESSKTG
jgi:hypothetical protein